jgi:glycosyltransferase involved in cell wall biosynthesis
MPTFTVIPTCADLMRFKPEPRAREGSIVLGYVGSAGTWYEFDATVACFAELLRIKSDARILIINRNEHEYIRQRLVAGGVPLAAVELHSATYAEVPMQLARMDASVFFIKPVFSKQASAPTKLAELLGCGIPCMANSGVGDMAEILEGEQVGIAVNDFAPQSLRAGLIRLLALMEEPNIEDRFVKVAQKYFSLDEGVHRYSQVYRRLDEARIDA